MGVKHSKQSVDISSTPVKPGVPVEVNGKTGDEKTEKIESITKVRTSNPWLVNLAQLYAPI